MIKSNKKIISILLVLITFFITTNVYADDYPDDIYDGDYSLQEMLENYNVITFGKKELDSHMTQSNFSKGNARIFHINSKFLVNGQLSVARIDLNSSNSNLSSFSRNYAYGYGYGIMCGYAEQDYPYSLLSGCNRGQSMTYYTDINNNYPYYATTGNYINFDRLYDSITTAQNKIKKGHYVSSEDNVAHVEIGGEYYIDDISNVKDIIFDNFEENNNKLTIITINNSEINQFPQLFRSDDSSNYNIIPTNDYIGMEKPNSHYADYYVTDTYYGNIIWNIPNATYIELPSTPFVGHLVAPNADVHGAETHYAGAFIVNSLYLEGNSEAHFYPLVIDNIPYRNSLDNYNARVVVKKDEGNVQFGNGINTSELEEGIAVTFTIKPENGYRLDELVIKDENDNIINCIINDNNEYEFIMPNTNVVITPKFVKSIINPNTRNTLLIVLLSLPVLGIGIYTYKKKESNKI